MIMPSVAILGCGPTGLLAAHAASLAGCAVNIVSKKEKSRLGGAQYLHTRIPLVTSPAPDGVLRVRKVGSAAGYTAKVYGTLPSGLAPSWGQYSDGQEVSAWSLAAAYDRLWERYEDLIVPVGNITYQDVVDNLQFFDGIISTVPLPAICRTMGPQQALPLAELQHTFTNQEIQVANLVPLHQFGPNTITYNGDKDYSWYRSSTIFGVSSTEWSMRGPKPPLPELRTIKKPLMNNCDCLSEHTNFVKTGRYGTWQKGFLSHMGYLDAARMVRNLFDLHSPLPEGMEELL